MAAPTTDSSAFEAADYDHARNTKSQMKLRSRRWCFTIYLKPDCQSFDIPIGLIEEIDNQTINKFCTYLVFQLELGKQSKRLHIQGYLEWSIDRTGRRTTDVINKAFTNFLPASIRKSCGSPEQASAYCKKEDTRVPGSSFCEFGKLGPGQGTRTDLAELCEAVIKMPLKDAASLYPEAYAKFSRGIERLHALSQPERDFKTVVIAIYGETGCGKTAFADKYYPGYYEKPSASPWWDGYDAHNTVLLNEFSYEKYGGRDFILKLFDRYPMRIFNKGSSCQFLARLIITCSKDNFLASESLEMRRRITFLIRMDKVVDPLTQYTSYTRSVEMDNSAAQLAENNVYISLPPTTSEVAINSSVLTSVMALQPSQAIREARSSHAIKLSSSTT